MNKAYKALLFLYNWLSWEQYKSRILATRAQGESEGNMANIRCDLCGLFRCQHINPRPPSDNVPVNVVPPAMPLGEPIGNVMETFSGVGVSAPPSIDRSSPIQIMEDKKIRVATEDEAKTFTSSTVKRIPILPPKAASLQEKKLITEFNTEEWVNCNICKGRVNVNYLDNHLAVHTSQYVPKETYTKLPACTAMVPHSDVVHLSSKPAVENKPTIPRLSPIEFYKFRRLDVACAASSVSQNGRYSDFTVIFWLKEKSTVHSATYVGGTTSISRESERLSIHVVYDSYEDYYTITSKFLKRSGYSTWDTEDTVPDRICYQEELLPEIKRVMLFFSIPPRTAYKMFRKLFKEGLVIEYDKSGRACIAQTQNSEKLSERIKSSSATSYGYGAHGRESDYWGDYCE